MASKTGKLRQNNFFDVCSKCKTSYSCCHATRPPIVKQRKEIIEDYLKREKIAIADAFVEEEYTFPRENAEGYCVFHDMKTRRCLIHSVKPETCVAGPITFDMNRKSGKIEWFVKMDKICQLAGKVYSDKEMFKNHLQSAKKEIRRLAGMLNSKELEAILQKDEPETFKIDEDVSAHRLKKLC